MEDDDEVMRVLQQARPAMEEKYHVRLSDEALKRASVHALGPFVISEDATPVKAVKLLDGACKLVLEKFKNFGYVSELCDYEYELRRAMAEHKELYRDNHSWSQSWVARVEHERNYAAFNLQAFLSNSYPVLMDSGRNALLLAHVEQVRYLKVYASQFAYLDRRLAEAIISEYSSKAAVKTVSQVLEYLYQTLRQRFLYSLTVEPCHVSEVVSRLTDVPLTQTLGPFVSSLKEKAIDKAKQRVVDQDDVIDNIFKIVAGPRHKTMRPRGAFLLLGGPGVGKREIAKAIAEHWYCDERRFLEINMLDYAETQFGSISCDLSPWSEDLRQLLWRRLTNAAKARSYSVILLDKVDKVSPSITKVLLNVLGNDAPSDCEGNPVDFSNTIIFMTSSVGVDQLQVACDCLLSKTGLRMQYCRDIKVYQMIHSCVPKGTHHGRVIAKARKFFSADLLESLDGLYVVEKFRNWKAVARLLLREIVSKYFGTALVAHASDAALGALLLKASKESVGPGNAIRKSWHEHVLPYLYPARGHNNAVICVDTLVGTRKLSSRFQAHERFMDEWVPELKDGSICKLIVDIKMKLESVYRIFELRSKWLPLLLHGTGQDLTQLGKQLLFICDSILMFAPSPDQPIRSSNKKEVSRKVDLDHHLPTAEEKEKILNSCRRIMKENESDRSKVPCMIAAGAMMFIDDPCPFPDLPFRSYLFLGLHGDLKTRLINEISELLSYGTSGKSLFKYFKLEGNNCIGQVLRKLLIEAVKDKPGMVIMLDGIENGDAKIQESLIEILDYGTTLDESADFRRTIIILTSEAANCNIIAKVLKRELIVQQPQNVKGFRTELLHRVDEITIFDPDPPHTDISRLFRGSSPYQKGDFTMVLPEFLFRLFELSSAVT